MLRSAELFHSSAITIQTDTRMCQDGKNSPLFVILTHPPRSRNAISAFLYKESYPYRYNPSFHLPYPK